MISLIHLSRRRRPTAISGLAMLGIMVMAGTANAQGQLSDQDRTQPIEIEADILTLEQENSLAIFEGHVLAVQGELSLKANRVKVHYSADGTTNEQSIRRIEAEGDVVIASPRETATGEAGVYDVVGETMQLTGDVVLTRDGNVLEGQQLDIDLATNTHRLSSPGGTSSGRIKALFVPASDNAGQAEGG